MGLFSDDFDIKKIALPDGIYRHTAITGTIVDLVEWCTFFPCKILIIIFLTLYLYLCDIVLFIEYSI